MIAKFYADSCPMGSLHSRRTRDSLRGHSEGRNVALKLSGKGIGGALYAGTRGILSGFFIIRVVL